MHVSRELSEAPSAVHKSETTCNRLPHPLVQERLETSLNPLPKLENMKI